MVSVNKKQSHVASVVYKTEDWKVYFPPWWSLFLFTRTHHKPDVPEPGLEAEPRCVSVKSDRSKEAIVVFKGKGSPAVEK